MCLVPDIVSSLDAFSAVQRIMRVGDLIWIDESFFDSPNINKA